METKKKNLIKLKTPTKKNKNLVIGSILKYKTVKKTSFKGQGEDLFFAIRYLQNKYDNFYVPIGDFKEDSVMKNITTSYRFVCETKGNQMKKEFKLFLPIPKEKLIKNIKKIFSNKYNIRYILLPLFIHLSRKCDETVGHFNMAVVDVKNFTFERFEPYGSSLNLKKHKNLNKKIVNIFKKAGIELDIIEINKFLPRISFQEIEERQIENNLASSRSTDPGGFCGVWSIWYIELLFRNRHLDRKDMIKETIKLIKEIGKKDKYNNFRKFIRRYAAHLDKERKRMLMKVAEDCDNINNIFNYQQCTYKYIKKKINKNL